MDAAFGKKGETTPDQLTPIEQLQTSLDVASRKGSKEALDGWFNINKAELKILSEQERSGITKAYNAALKQLEGGAK
jgi:hypothetical protein